MDVRKLLEEVKRGIQVLRKRRMCSRIFLTKI